MPCFHPWVGALRAFGALESGMKEEELKPLVDAWHLANPNIVNFWWEMDRAAKDCIKERSTKVAHGIQFIYQGRMMFIELPRGRRLAYVKSHIGESRLFGGEFITHLHGTRSLEKVGVDRILRSEARGEQSFFHTLVWFLEKDAQWIVLYKKKVVWLIFLWYDYQEIKTCNKLQNINEQFHIYTAKLISSYRWNVYVDCYDEITTHGWHEWEANSVGYIVGITVIIQLVGIVLMLVYGLVTDPINILIGVAGIVGFFIVLFVI